MGSSRRLANFISSTSTRVTNVFRRRPFLAFPVTGASALLLCGLVVWLVAFRGGSEDSAGVLGEEASATPGATATAAITATVTPAVAPTAGMQAAGATPGTAAPPPESGPANNQAPAAESAMRFKIPSIGVDAPVTIRAIAADGQMGAPNGRFDVVWYDFSAFAGMGGYPGDAGNAVFSGHVDYHPNYEAVFWDLRLVGPGDLIEVDLPSGTIVRYSVQWTETITPDVDFSSYVTNTGQDVITIVTCQGTFNSATHNYDHRLVVRGVRIP